MFLPSTTSKTKQFCETSSFFQSWQHQSRSNSARLLHFSKLTTSKTKQFCETSSIFELDNIKNEAILRDFFMFSNLTTSKRSNSARLPSIFEVDNIKNDTILRDFLQKWKVECSADGLVPMRFAIFPLHLSKVLRLPRKIDARSYEVLHLSRKIILANLQIWCSKMQPLSGNQRPDLLTSLMNMSFLYCACHAKCIFADPLQMSHACEMLQYPHVLLTFQKVHNPLCRPRETTSERPKDVRTPGVFNMLTSKCASRHNGVHFFDIATPKSGPTLMCFIHFDFEMCFAPQRRALFRHLNVQKWSEAEVFCTF